MEINTIKQIYMKYSAVLSIFILFASGCNHTDAKANLLSEQAILKDSANNMTERIGGYMHQGVYDSSEADKKQLGSVHARLIAIQVSLDSLEKTK
jgi:hypothetical protein